LLVGHVADTPCSTILGGGEKSNGLGSPREFPARCAFVMGEDPALSGKEPALTRTVDEDPAPPGKEPAQRVARKRV
jgi:hypothetical protein